MKKATLTLITLLGLIGFSQISVAQTKAEKKEIKEWKKKLKKTDPLEFRDLYNGINEAKREASALRNQIAQFDEEKANLQSTIASKDAQIQQMREKLEASASSGSTGDDWSEGVVYKVQVGAFRDKDLSQYQQMQIP